MRTKPENCIKRMLVAVASLVLALALCPALALADEGGSPSLAAGASDLFDASSVNNSTMPDLSASSHWEVENNNDYGVCDHIELGDTMRGKLGYVTDKDVFSVSLPRAGKLNIGFNVKCSESDYWYVYVYDSSYRFVTYYHISVGSVSYNGESGEDVDFGDDTAYLQTGRLKAGLYYITVSSDNGEEWSNATYSITPKLVNSSLAGATIASIPGKYYTGKAIKPAVTVKLGGETLKAGTDYTVSYKNNVKVGTATVTVTGKGAYTGSKTATFKIVGKPSYAGATRMPVASKAAWTLKNCTLKVVSGTGVVSVKGNVVTAKKAGIAKIGVFNKLGTRVATRSVTVYGLSGRWIMQSCMKGKSNMCLDMDGEGKGNGVQMIVWPRHGRANQQFWFSRQSDGSYVVKSVNSKKVLDVNGASKAWGRNVIQWQANGGKNQRWRLTVDASNRITFTNVNSGLVFDVDGGVANAGARMIQWGANGGLNQKWNLRPVSNFVGSWIATRAYEGGKHYNESFFKAAKSRGMTVTLRLNYNHTAKINSLGKVYTSTWYEGDGNGASQGGGGKDVSRMTIENGKLMMRSGNDWTEFTRTGY